MAANSTSKNQQFLQQFERQRLNKPCNRIIDLRGKVAGECQAYTFGGKTHYLDDRAYLLAKQLLDRFNGRYTLGVYESVLKALKSLANQTKKTESPSNLSASNQASSTVALLPFDRQLQRKEPRITYASPVEIRIADVLYHGSTMDITSSAIGVSLKRTFTLNKNDEVSVTFTGLSTEESLPLLSKVPYKILKIDHDELRTQLILVRNRHDNDVLTQWLDKWSQHHNSIENIDLDNEIFNLTTHYYLRLYCRTLNSPIFWLNPHEKVKPIQAFQMSEMAEDALQILRQQHGDLDFSLLPFDQLISEQEDYLLLLSAQSGSSHPYLVRRNDPKDVANLLYLHSQQTNSQVLLLQTYDSSVELDNFEDEISHIAKIDSDYASNLQQRLADISLVATVSNISHSCQNLNPIPPKDDIKQIDQQWDGQVPLPTVFRHHIQRDTQRFLIRTSIHLHIPSEDKIYKVTTTDVSEGGLSLSLPEQINLKVGTHVKIDFVRWQSQTKKVKLVKLPYIVRNNQFHSGASHLGLEREAYGCDPSVNKFFTRTIEHNKEQLAENNADVFLSQETQIFSSLLVQHLSAIPFYLAMDKTKRRQLQAVATSSDNHANTPALWLAMQEHVLAMSQLLNESSDKSICFGLYCYQEKSGEWKIQTDMSLSTTTQKSLFINKAMRYEDYHFYNCVLTPIKSSLIEQEDDLNQALLEFRSHSPHKVKQVRETLHSLYAVGELIDITDIIEAGY